MYFSRHAGFGSNNNTQTQSGSLFGGQQNRTGGFGTTNTPSTGGSLFGSTPNTGNAGGFGSSTGGGFGSGTTGGFGANANSNTSGGLFGANKPAGGFGTPAATGGGFGSNPTGGAFGSSTNTGFGSGATPLAGGAVAPCDGTGSTPFNPFTEKDTSSNTMNHYQSVSFMPPYKNYSFEELRLADYERGRRFGNGSNQAGAFGSSSFGGNTTGTGFGSQQNTTGGFGASASTPFGAANTSAPSTFGSTQTAGGFGSTNNSNPLFGANKPANSMFGGGAATTQAGSLFGGNTATAGTGGGFGSSAGTGGAFGSNTNTGGGLFGGNQPAKPAFGATPATGTTGGFGSGGGFGAQQNTANSNPFGGSTTTGSTGFGQQQQTGTSAFGGGLGANQNQTQNKSLFGGGTGGGFGSNNQQQGTGGSLFGGAQTQQPATGGGLFGGASTQPQQQGTGGLFGGNQSQPAAGGGLFGGQNQQQQKPGGLFGGGAGSTGGGAFGGLGASQTQQPAGGGLFGGQQQQQQKPGGLFGGSTGATGGGLFGQSNNTQQNAGSSLFGNQSQQQQPAGNSLFGGSQPAPQQSQPVPGSLTSSLLGGNPYGSQSIFSGLPTPDAPSPGPLATPLSSSMRQKQRAPLPYSITPGGANRLSTPPKRQGYGFSYSTYGSPSSSSSTPSGFSNSLLGGGGGSSSLRGSIGGSFGRSFSKSYSTSNLRKTFDPESDSVLSPGALQSSGGRSNGGSMKRLTIDRSLRTDLFARPASTSPAPTLTNGDDSTHPDKLKKKVSFDASPSAVQGTEIVRVESKSPEPTPQATPQELGFLRSQRRSGSLNGIDGNGSERPEMESISRDLAVVPENGEPISANTSSVKRPTFVPGSDPKPGEYWMKPSRAELNKMSRDQLKQVVNFTVGRQHCGSVTFNGAVDLTTVDMENIYGKIVEIGVRKITVYPDETIKPPMGKGLNVVSTLRIENSWPRGRDRKSPLPITSGPLFDKHIDRLQKVHDTEFIDYDTQTGTWVFKVPHFTTYGLDYDEDEEGESLDQSTLGAGPDDNRTPKAQPDHPVSFEQSATFSIDESFVGSMAGIDDDTFDFKKRKLVPGSFGSQAMEMEDEEMGSEGETESFLEEGSTGSTTEHEDDVTESQRSGDSVVGSDEDQEMDMAGSFPHLHHTVEREDSQSTDGELDTTHPIKHFGTPPKPRLDLSGDWAEQLQRTISPRKQNRDALREIQANAFADRALLNDGSPEAKSNGSPKKGFTNSIDLMNSLFQQPRKQSAPSPLKPSKAQPKGFEVRTPFSVCT
jgi:nuclear pore complex protein Nup98-Nup96